MGDEETSWDQTEEVGLSFSHCKMAMIIHFTEICMDRGCTMLITQSSNQSLWDRKDKKMNSQYIVFRAFETKNSSCLNLDRRGTRSTEGQAAHDLD